MHNREDIKNLYRSKEIITDQIKHLTDLYIDSLGDNPGIYITDHAIERYADRVLNLKEFDYRDIRLKMLTLEDDRLILNKQLGYFKKGNQLFIIKELSVVTVILN